MFKISAIAASLLVSGILVGCGSSDDGDNSGGVTPDPKPQNRSVVVTDDYVVGATVFNITKKSRVVSRANNSSVGFDPDPIGSDVNGSVLPGGTGGSTPINPDPINPSAGYKVNIIVPSVNSAKGEYKGDGKYEIVAGKDDILGSNGGVNDVNANGKADSNEPRALPMATKPGYSNMNPFTTLVTLTDFSDSDVAKLFGVEKVDFDTTKTTKVEDRQAVALANAVIAHVVYGNGTDGKAELQKTLKAVSDEAKANGGKTADAVAKVVGDDSYKNLPTDLQGVNGFITTKLLSFGKTTGGSSEPEKPDDNGTSGNTGCVLPGC